MVYVKQNPHHILKPTKTKNPKTGIIRKNNHKKKNKEERKKPKGSDKGSVQPIRKDWKFQNPLVGGLKKMECVIPNQT